MNRTAALLLACLSLVFACKPENNAVNNEPAPPLAVDGATCSSDRQCDGDSCLTISDGWTGGYCTTRNCAERGCNGPDSACVRFVDESSLCFTRCDGHADCRDGYRCLALDASDEKVCFRTTSDGPAAGAVGSECETDDDCGSDAVCDTESPGGYCLIANCAECTEESTCATWNGQDQCVSSCSGVRDCRVGYRCQEAVCVPGDPAAPPFPFGDTETALQIRCDAEEIDSDEFGTRWRMNYEISETAAGYAVVPFVKVGALRPITIELPSGKSIDLIDDYKHLNLRARELLSFEQRSGGTYGAVSLDWPLIVPYSPDRQPLVEAGTHVIEVVTSVAPPCLYALETDGTGVVVDLNVVFMGLDGYSAARAPSDPDLAAVFSRVGEILAQVGLGIGDVRYFDAPSELSERYAHIRGEAEMRHATSFGAPRDATLDGHLSVDMFLVEDIRLSGGSAALGLSAGLPGPPGLHGNAANGLVFSGVDLGSNNDFVAHIMAHELGHFLGLRHTTERAHNREAGIELAAIGTTDPIEDTPVCPLVDGFQVDCPDATNLMFPVAPDREMMPSLPELTTGQSLALHANPLFKAE